MNTIRRTAGEIIDGIEESMREQFKERQEEKGKDIDIFMIFQLNDDEKGIRLKFENMNYLQAKGLKVERENYHFVYSGELKREDTLDGIYERFNIDHPKDYTGHSLSVSDVIVVRRDGEEQAYFVDSVGLQKLPDFSYHAGKEQQPAEQAYDTEAVSAPLPYSQCAYETPDGYFSIHSTEDGYDNSFFDKDYKLLDGGLLENEPGKEPRNIDQAVSELFTENNLKEAVCREISFDELTDHTDDANPPPAATHVEQLARDLDDFLHSHDTYEYWDRVEDRGQNVKEIMNDLEEGTVSSMKDYLQAAHMDNPTAETESLLKRLEAYDKRDEALVTEKVQPSYYVAECMEFPMMGEYHDNLTIDEAVEIYESIPADRMNGIKGIGINLDDGSIYSGSIDLMQGGRMDTEMVDSIGHYRNNEVVQQALQELREHYPEREAVREKGAIYIGPGSERVPLKESDKDRGQGGTEGNKESVLKALKERRNKLKVQEQQEKPNKDREKRKGELTI